MRHPLQEMEDNELSESPQQLNSGNSSFTNSLLFYTHKSVLFFSIFSPQLPLTSKFPLPLCNVENLLAYTPVLYISSLILSSKCNEIGVFCLS